MELYELATEIKNKIMLLKKCRNEIKKRAERKSRAITEYEKKIAITIIKLKNGVEMEIDDEKIEKPPATLIEKIARGICWKEKLEMETAESEYKSIIVCMDSIQAELNGYQSINRHLKEV